MEITYPDPFLEVRVQVLELPTTIGLCAGYESGAWRTNSFANHLFQWLPYAALSRDHLHSFAAHNFLEHLRVAAAHIYKTKKIGSRGELGELMLHLACITHCKTTPLVCKLLLKTSSNDTVKGFDGVHLLPTGSGFELFLGESKFYDGDGKQAIRDAVKSVREHILPDFLATEKAMLIGHVPADIPHKDKIVKLFKQQTSGDDLIAASVFPILITYESQSVSTFKKVADDYVESLNAEITKLRTYFGEQAKGLAFRFHLIFVPLKNKGELVSAFDELLEPFK